METLFCLQKNLQGISLMTIVDHVSLPFGIWPQRETVRLLAHVFLSYGQCLKWKKK